MTDDLTPARVAEMAAAATPGPLGIASVDPNEGYEVVRLSDGAYTASYCTEGDAALYAAAPAMATLIAKLAAENERLVGENRVLSEINRTALAALEVEKHCHEVTKRRLVTEKEQQP